MDTEPAGVDESAQAAETGHTAPDSRFEPAPLRRTWGFACLVLFFAALILSLVVPCAWLFDLYPRFRPSLTEQRRVEQELKDYAQSQWQGRAVLEKFEVELEREGSDYPLNHEWKEYRYFATFRIKGTDARFFASLPLDTHDAFGSWWSMSSKLTDDEIALLKAYSRETSTPAGLWGRDEYGLYDRAYPGKEIWSVTPVALGQVFSTGSDELLFEKEPSGEFRPLDNPY